MKVNLRRAERTKRCTACQTVKPWSDYHAKVKWEDGTIRQPQSRCTACSSDQRRERELQARRRNCPTYRARKARARAKVRQDPECLSRLRDYDREWKRRRNGITPDRYVVVSRPVHGGPKVPAAPFAKWLATLGTTTAAIARVTELNERRIHGVIKGEQERVELDTVDRALLAVGDGTTLEDIYGAQELTA